MTRFAECLAFVLQREGGYVNNPNDPGGATNMGVTQRTFDKWRDDHAQPRADVKTLDIQEAADIYQALYWNPAACEQLPPPLDLIQFDTAVNEGPGTAARMLQTALVLPIIDGTLGPKTLKAASTCDPLATFARYANQRSMRYIGLAIADPNKRVFLRGWLHRVGALLSAV